MNWYIPIFTSKFPFLKFKKRDTPYEYVLIFTQNLTILNEKEKVLIRKNKELLSLNQIPLNKIRFIFKPTFTYDVDHNIINPHYETFMPLRKDGSGFFDDNAPVIEINKPKNLLKLAVDTYRTNDSYAIIKQMVKKSKRGVVIFIADYTVSLHDERTSPYEYSVDGEVLKIFNLNEIN
jgi:hypothetical protein